MNSTRDAATTLLRQCRDTTGMLPRTCLSGSFLLLPHPGMPIQPRPNHATADPARVFAVYERLELEQQRGRQRFPPPARPGFAIGNHILPLIQPSYFLVPAFPSPHSSLKHPPAITCPPEFLDARRGKWCKARGSSG